MNREIKTERLTIKPYGERDKPRLAELLTDERIKETFMIPDFPSGEALEAAVDKLCAASGSDVHFVRDIYLGEELIGFVNDVETVGSEIEIGYAIHPDFHNRGYATEMFRAVIGELLGSGYSAVVAGAFWQNLASIRVMLKCGMTRIAREEDVPYRGKTLRCVYFEIR